MFELNSKFKPTGDQPQAIKELTKALKSGKKFQTLLGVTGSGKTFTMANMIAEMQKPTIVIAHNKTLAAQLCAEFREFFPKNAVSYFVSYYDYYQPESYLPQNDLYIEKDADVNEEIDRLRHQATMNLLSRRDVIIIASVSCIYGLGSPDFYEKAKIKLKTEQKLKRNDFLKNLIKISYQRNDMDFHRGTFRVRGDVVDIFPGYEDENIVRINFFGDEIEKIEIIDALTGKLFEKKSEVEIYPNTHYVLPPEGIEEILEQIKNDMKSQVKKFGKSGKLLEAQRLTQRTKFDLEMIKETGSVKGIENYSKYFDGRKSGEPPKVLLDYFPKDFLMFIDESHMTIPQIGGMYEGDKARKGILVEYGFRLPSAKDNRPLTFDEFERHYNQCVFVSATPKEYELKKSGGKPVEQLIRPTGLLDPTVEVKPTKNQIDDLMNEISKCAKKKQRMLITTLTKRMAEDLTNYLAEANIKVHYLHSEIDTLERLEILKDLRFGKYDVVVGINLLREGLDLPEVSLIVILDADKEGFLRSDVSLIQTMGRAARHISGHVIMYADRLTGSMKRAINETRRRRRTQNVYNKKHGITPRGIKKAIRDDSLVPKDKILSKKDIANIPQDEIKRITEELEAKMDLAAKNLEFEKAARLRNKVIELRKMK
ncbi:MAG: hypothetical protein ACD_63C00254G0002 [uncultured bacterium]|nr:MAG: hypothetical protein ACD_63C00254G0002 [uncultured bacterium]